MPRIASAWLVSLGLAVSACADRSTAAGGAGTSASAGDTDPGSEATADATDATSGTDSGGPTRCGASTPGPAVSEAEMASSMAAILCQAQVECDCPDRSHDSVPSCRHSMSMAFEYVRAQAQARALTYDGDCLGQLEAAIEALGCDVVDPAEAFADILGAGRCAVYHGERTRGEPCDALANFATTCAQGLACWDGVCVDVCQAGHGTRTNPYGYACPPGEAMWGQQGECHAPSARGESCGPGGCEAGAYCKSVFVGEDQLATCVDVVGLGGSCDTDEECGAALCEGNACRPAPIEAEACISDRCGPGLLCNGSACVLLPSICGG